MIVTFNSLVLAAASCGFLQTCQWSLVSAAIPSRSRWSRTNSVPWKEQSACWTMHLNVAVVSFQVFFFLFYGIVISRKLSILSDTIQSIRGALAEWAVWGLYISQNILSFFCLWTVLTIVLCHFICLAQSKRLTISIRPKTIILGFGM